ncbi:MAG TPA: PAS domain S-box protein [Steroidobacteraceae bacterium]|nr:PAS domain S-box protein [Steroidobacteraceae bacterium]
MTPSLKTIEPLRPVASAGDNGPVGSDHWFRLAVEGVQTYAIFMLNPHGQVATWNIGAERIKGYTAAEIIGKNFSCFYLQEDIDQGRPQETLRVASEQGRVEVRQFRVRKDGSRFLANLVITALHDQAGTLIGYSEISRDMTEHVMSEAKYRRLLEAAPDAMVVVNQDGEIVLLNLQAENQFGYRRDELLGQRVTTIIPEGFAERLLADALRPAEEALAQQIGTGIELIGRRKDGGAFPIEIMLSPHASAEGILVTAAIRNISVRREAERQLNQMTQALSLKHRLLNSVVEGTSDPIYIRDLEDRFVLANSACAKLYRRSGNDMAGMRLSDLMPDGPYRVIADSDWEIIRTGITRTVEEVAELDGAERIFLTTKGPYRDAENKIIGTIGIGRDITELRRLDEVQFKVLTHDIRVRKTAAEYLANTVAELKRSNDELEHFAYIASHDLQEPLRMVASYTQLLAERYHGRLDADADDFIAFAIDGADRMQRLILDLLAYSRAGANVGESHTISSERALQVALANLRAAIAESGAEVTHDALPDIIMDDGQLTQIFQNLVGNAIKYRGIDVPHIHISCVTGDATQWIFSVRDNGIGIESEYFEKIFILFRRLHRREEFEGTGLGLSICKKLLDRIGGRVWVESQPREGSTFSFSIPKGIGE